MQKLIYFFSESIMKIEYKLIYYHYNERLAILLWMF